MKGLILAGGHGTRLRPLTHTGPKQLIPLANKPNILYCLEDLRDAGITDIGVILGDVMPEKVKELLGDGQAHGVGISYAVFCLKKKKGATRPLRALYILSPSHLPALSSRSARRQRHAQCTA